MTNNEAAKILLYKLSRSVSEDKYMDAICLAVCALMREEEAGKGKHEESESFWHEARDESPKCFGAYIANVKKTGQRIEVLWNGSEWLMSKETLYDTIVNPKDILWAYRNITDNA